MATDEALDPAFGAALGRLGPLLLASLEALEETFRRLHPPDLPLLRERLEPLAPALAEARRGLDGLDDVGPLESFRAELSQAARLVLQALEGLSEPPDPDAGVARVLGSMHRFARAQAALYPLRHAVPPFSAFFAEPFRHASLDRLERAADVEAEVGLFRAAGSEQRGGFDLYVPESWDGREAWPLIVALHGGSGHGSDFLWTWLREARSRRCLLLAPTSSGPTWSLHAPDVDGSRLADQVDWVASRWAVDREHVMLTGLSDGATMTLLVGLAEGAPFTHLAPISGVLHPANLAGGNLERARGKPIQLVHGVLDWMFPVSLAREAARVLEQAGADLAYHEIDDLSHTYPREQNARLIEWLDSRRAVPDASGI